MTSACTAPVQGHTPGSKSERDCPSCGQRSSTRSALPGMIGPPPSTQGSPEDTEVFFSELMEGCLEREPVRNKIFIKSEMEIPEQDKGNIHYLVMSDANHTSVFPVADSDSKVFMSFRVDFDIEEDYEYAAMQKGDDSYYSPKVMGLIQLCTDPENIDDSLIESAGETRVMFSDGEAFMSEADALEHAEEMARQPLSDLFSGEIAADELAAETVNKDNLPMKAGRLAYLTSKGLDPHNSDALDALERMGFGFGNPSHPDDDVIESVKVMNPDREE